MEDQQVLTLVAEEYPRTTDKISELDTKKKSFTKQLSKYKSSVRKILKRKYDETKLSDPHTSTISLQVGPVLFSLDEVTTYKSCPVEEMDAFFSKESIIKYKASVEKKRLKLTVA